MPNSQQQSNRDDKSDAAARDERTDQVRQAMSEYTDMMRSGGEPLVSVAEIFEHRYGPGGCGAPDGGSASDSKQRP